jgi:O-antigen ligase
MANSSSKPTSIGFRGTGLPKLADFFAMMMGITLPWSTTVFAIFAFAWAVALLPAIDVNTFGESLRKPLCAFPIALFALAVLGMFWSEAPWNERVYAAGTLAKLLALPLLFYQFQHSASGLRVFKAFLILVAC